MCTGKKFFRIRATHDFNTISAPLDLRAFQGDQGPQTLPNMQQGMLLQRPVFKMNPTNEFWDQSRVPSQTPTPPNALTAVNNASINRTIATATNSNNNNNNNNNNNSQANVTGMNSSSVGNQTVSTQSSMMVSSQSMLPPTKTEPINPARRTPETNCTQNLPLNNFSNPESNTNNAATVNSVDSQAMDSTNMNQNNAVTLPDPKIMTEKLVSELQVRIFF